MTARNRNKQKKLKNRTPTMANFLTVLFALFAMMAFGESRFDL